MPGPVPGFWRSTTGDQFFVTSDRAFVDNFTMRITVNPCGTYEIIHTPQVPLTKNDFSFLSPNGFYASGTFHSTTTASGTDGLTNYFIPGCGVVNSGPWSWNATWQSGVLPTVIRTAEVITSVDEIRLVPAGADKSTTVTRVD
jgi:hypothetical protein